MINSSQTKALRANIKKEHSDSALFYVCFLILFGLLFRRNLALVFCNQSLDSLIWIKQIADGCIMI